LDLGRKNEQRVEGDISDRVVAEKLKAGRPGSFEGIARRRKGPPGPGPRLKVSSPLKKE